MRWILFLLARLWRGSPIGGIAPSPAARALFAAALLGILLLLLVRLFY